MSAERAASNPVMLAVLNEGGELVGELRTALQALGASIVFEAPARSLDRDALKASGARVVVINLGAPGGDGIDDDELDRLSELLDADDYEIVINDSEASRQLAATDHARWARHLAAKILRRPEITLPPAPPGAQPVPTSEQHWASQVPVADTWGVTPESPAPALREAMPAPVVFATEPQGAASDAAQSGSAESEPVQAASEQSEPVQSAPQTLSFEQPASEHDALGSLPVAEPEPLLPMTDAELLLLEPMAESAARPAEIPADDNDVPSDADLTLALESFEAAAGNSTVDDDNLQDFDSLFVDASITSQTVAEPPPRAPEAGQDLRSDAKTGAAPKETAAVKAPNWSLEPVDDGETAEPASPAKAQPAEFGIETIPAHVYLAPHVDSEPAAVSESKSAGDSSAVELDFLSSLELVPLESEAPAAPRSTVSYDTGKDLELKTVAPSKRASEADASDPSHQDTKK